MLNIEPTQIYPCFYPCKNEAEFQMILKNGNSF
jgi:hypothetical protein